MPDFDADTYATLRAFLPSFIATDPFRRFGCHAVGIGRRHRNGARTDEITLRLYVARKIPEEVLDYRLGRDDVARIARLADSLRTGASEALQRDFSRLALAGKGLSGMTVAKVLGLE